MGDGFRGGRALKVDEIVMILGVLIVAMIQALREVYDDCITWTF